MNTVFIGYELNPTGGGIERFNFSLLNTLAAQGHSLHIALAYPGKEATIPFKNAQILSFKAGRCSLAWWESRKLVRAFSCNSGKIDHVICAHLYLLPIAARVARSLGAPLVLLAYGIECWSGRTAKYRRWIKYVHRVGSISQFTTDQLIQQGVAPDRIVYYPPTLEQTKTEILSSCIDRKKSSDFPVFLTVGRLASSEQYKGHDQVIRAMSGVLQEIPNAEYWIVGRGDDTERLRQLSQECGVTEKVKFLGFQSDEALRKIYERATLFIMPSRVSLDPVKPEGEGFGIVFIEAALTGLPCIGPDSAGSVDIIQHEVTGLTVDPRCVESIAAALLRLTGDPKLRARLGGALNEHVAENFSKESGEHYVDELLETKK